MEDEMYGVPPPTAAEYSDKALMTPENLIFPAEYHSFLMSTGDRIPMFGSDELLSAAASAVTEAEPSSNIIAPEIQRHHDASSLIKAKIASHPHYPRLLQAYIDCQKVINCSVVTVSVLPQWLTQIFLLWICWTENGYFNYCRWRLTNCCWFRWEHLRRLRVC